MRSDIGFIVRQAYFIKNVIAGKVVSGVFPVHISRPTACECSRAALESNAYQSAFFKRRNDRKITVIIHKHVVRTLIVDYPCGTADIKCRSHVETETVALVVISIVTGDFAAGHREANARIFVNTIPNAATAPLRGIMAYRTARHSNSATPFTENAAAAGIVSAAIITDYGGRTFYRKRTRTVRPYTAAPACAVAENRTTIKNNAAGPQDTQTAAATIGSNAARDITACKRIIGCRAANRSNARCIKIIIMSSLGCTAILYSKRAARNYYYASAGISNAMVIKVKSFCTRGNINLPRNVFQ